MVGSCAAAVGIAGFEDVLGLGPAEGVCVLLVDGLGWVQLAEHPEAAPFLTELASGSGPLTVGFPSTTVAGIGSVATGLAPGDHGLVGFWVRVPRLNDNLNLITWQTQSDNAPALDRLPPEEFQPHTTMFERLASVGVPVAGVLPAGIQHSGLSRATLRGLDYRPVLAYGEQVATVAQAAASGSRLVYTYISELDTVGHHHGPGSDHWIEQIRVTDAFVQRLAERIPPGYLLVVTADHGMSWVDRERSIDFDTGPDVLRQGLTAIAGERRARYLYTEDPSSVAERWSDHLGDDFLVVTKDQALDAGWFGPAVRADVDPLIGDVIVCSLGPRVIVRSAVEADSMGPGTHGSLTEGDRLVPLLSFRK